MPGREQMGSPQDPFDASAPSEPTIPLRERLPSRWAAPFVVLVVLAAAGLGAAVYGMLASIRISHDALRYASGLGVLIGFAMLMCTVTVVIAIYRAMRYRRPIDVAAALLAVLLPPAIFVVGVSSGLSVLADNLGEDISLLVDASSWLLALVAVIREAFE